MCTAVLFRHKSTITSFGYLIGGGVLIWWRLIFYEALGLGSL
jgi:hypothetical protein